MVREIVGQLLMVPWTWWLPRRERALLAIVGIIFWGATIQHALYYDASHASVISLFGLGLLYVIFSLCNLVGGMSIALTQHALEKVHESHPRTLTELFVVLLGMFVGNFTALLIYVIKGAPLTMVDTISFGMATVLLLFLVGIYGYEALFKHPIARGWLAIAGKTVPQIVTAVLFILYPHTASSLALITLLGIDMLSGLRLIPTVKAFRRDRNNQHLRGLLLGEVGNSASGLLLTIAWLIAQVR